MAVKLCCLCVTELRILLQVLGVTFDGASVNRRLFKLHHLTSDELVYKVPNPYASDGRDLLIFSDPPHLMKTSRNCWASKARNLLGMLHQCH